MNELHYIMLKSVIYIVQYNEIFNPMIFDFTLCNYGGHVGGHAEVHQYGAATFTLNIQTFCSPITSSRNAFFCFKNYPRVIVLLALQAKEFFFI